MRQLQGISQFKARMTPGIIMLDKSTRNKIFLEFSGVFVTYNGVCLRNFQRIEEKLVNAFLAKISILLRIS